MKQPNRKLKKESLILGKLLQKLAPQIDASVFLEPEWNIAGQITFKSGEHSYFRYNTLDLNPVGASDIAKDKDYSNQFMKRLGYPVVPNSMTFFTDKWAEAIGVSNRSINDAYAYAQKLGWPVVVKPNGGSQGFGVAIVRNRREFYRAIRVAFKLDKIALVQSVVTGKDYRLVVLDDEIISAYERTSLCVIGDGKSSIAKLLLMKQRRFEKIKRDTLLKPDDPRLLEKLRSQGMSLSSIPKNEHRVFLLDNANLSTGGDSIDVTAYVHPKFKELAIRLTRDMNLRLCGVDLMVDGDISKEPVPDKYWVLEINAAPGLDHYAKVGPEQEKAVEKLYLRVLKHLEH